MQILPLPITAAFHVLQNFLGRHELKDIKGEDGKSDKSQYNDAVLDLFDTAVAVGGYVAISNFADKWHNGLLPVAVASLLIFPHALWIGTTGYYTVAGAAGIVHAIRERNPLNWLHMPL